MYNCVKVFIPISPSTFNDTYFRGYVDFSENLNIYLTETLAIGNLQNDVHNSSIIGLCSKHNKTRKPKTKDNLKNEIVLHCDAGCINIKKLIINKLPVTHYTYIILLYEYDKVKNSESINTSNHYLSKLKSFIVKDDNCIDETKMCKSIKDNKYLDTSMLCLYTVNYINKVKWLSICLLKEKKISIKVGNFLTAVLLDIVLGYLFLTYLAKEEIDISNLLMGALERLVNYLYSLLKWIMGAPAGLKLNNAFNKMLGKYFSYHIQLWWLFLEVSSQKLDIVIQIYQLVGYLGITFQAAIVSDMFCFATFHSYCIYVYAARLFNIQISGLKALLRLFVGRKYNPLRNSVDSCEYTNQELFVGTVAFTILLLLLPTTLMYYVVFTLLRLLSLIMQYALAKFIYLVQTLPIYVFGLWITRSSKVAGNVLVEDLSSDTSNQVVLKIKLLTKPLGELIQESVPPVEPLKHMDWKELLTNVISGKQLV